MIVGHHVSGIAVTEASSETDIALTLSPRRMTMIAKRNFDVFSAVVLLGVTLPLLALIACLIKLLDTGPLFYRHLRIGQGGRLFYCLKFRTMRPDADVRLRDLMRAYPEMQAEWHLTGKLKYDPRVTWIGHILRKTSLDELPQIINVLLGDMSLVGPRPVVRSEIELHYHGIARAAYFAVRPGITGLWQVSGRSDAGYERRVELDAEYVRNLSIFRDLVLLARTVLVVIACNGAY